MRLSDPYHCDAKSFQTQNMLRGGCFKILDLNRRDFQYLPNTRLCLPTSLTWWFEVTSFFSKDKFFHSIFIHKFYTIFKAYMQVFINSILTLKTDLLTVNVDNLNHQVTDHFIDVVCESLSHPVIFIKR